MFERPTMTQNPLAPEARLDLVAEILAQAVRRSLLRREQLVKQESRVKSIAQKPRERLACCAARSVHHSPTRPRKEKR